MNQTVTEGFGVGRMAAEFDVAASTTAGASLLNKPSKYKANNIKKHYKGDQLRFSEYL